MNVPQKEIDWAIEVAEKLPEKYQASAFAEMLRYALLQKSVSVSDTKSLTKEASRSSLTNVSIIYPDLEVLANQGNRDQHVAWAIAELHARNEEVNNTSIRKIIRERLAIAPPARQNTNRSLRNLTPKYVVRTKVGNKYHYAPSEKFAELFNNLNESTDGDSK